MPAETIDSVCEWSKNYTVVPDNLECIPSFCDNATEAPSNDRRNYKFVWDGELMPVNTVIKYQCQDAMKIENDTTFKYEASNHSKVKCGNDGEFRYPDPWPQCSETINCTDPGMTAEVNRTYETGKYLEYLSVLEYWCLDTRKYLRWQDIENSKFREKKDTQCQWNKNFTRDATNLVCKMHHCAHPHDDPGYHDAPALENNITLVDRDWVVDFGDFIMYQCDSGTLIENDELDPTETNIKVECIPDLGEYDTPDMWPNCTQTVNCGQPPAIPPNGSINWLNGTEYDDTYDNYVRYACVNGSQFDTDDDGDGDNITVQTRCQWNKIWAPFAKLPQCKITHCVQPFPIPEDSFLEEVTSSWTKINKNKEYRCRGKVNGTHTRFWESDRQCQLLRCCAKRMAPTNLWMSGKTGPHVLRVNK